MCGLAGMAGYGILGKHLRAFKELLYVSALRGTDSTGVYAVKSRRQKQVDIVRKDVIDSADFLWKHDKQGSFLNDMTFDLFMGHVRDATVGKVTQQNAHPFDLGSLVGAHNGTIRDREFMSPDKTDSQMMFEKMQSVGVKETLERMSWWDAYAISVYDKQSRRLILSRNDQRPLWMGFSEIDDVMMYSSDQNMLRLVSDRHGLKLKIFFCTPGVIYSVDISEIKQGNTQPYMTETLKKDDWLDDLPWGNAL